MAFIKSFFISAVALITLIFLANIVVDPYCFFGPSNQFFKKKFLFDERIQKTNFIVFNTRQFDGLLIGSSRAAIISPENFTENKYFNYSVTGLLPWEYSGFIKIFRKHNPQLKKIIIGFDFWATNPGKRDFNKYNPEYYAENLPIFNMVSFQALKFSRISVSCSLRKNCYERSYTSSFTRTWVPVTDDERKLRTSIQLDAYKSGYYGRSYSLAPDFESHIKRLRLENPGVRIIAFTTPDSAELFRLLVKQGLYNDYLKWLGVLSENFDEVYDFMGVNSVTTNSKNYIDSQHFSPIVGSYIAAVIEKKNVPGMPLDFGVQLRR